MLFMLDSNLFCSKNVLEHLIYLPLPLKVGIMGMCPHSWFIGCWVFKDGVCRHKANILTSELSLSN